MLKIYSIIRKEDIMKLTMLKQIFVIMTWFYLLHREYTEVAMNE